MQLTNAIYYTEKLHPIPVQVVERKGERACIKTNAGKLFDVQASRLIAVLEPMTGAKANYSIRTKPFGYITVCEYLTTNRLEADSLQQHKIKVFCGWECRKAQIPSWKGQFQVVYYPKSIIDTCYKKMISEGKP
jgi:hypothetical protein